MKRILYFVLASVMLVSVSCKKEPQQHEPQTVAVASVELDKASVEATELDEFTLTATVLPDNATNKNVVWSVTDENILAVDQNGKVTAILAGTAKVVVTTEEGGFTAECTVTVKELIVPPTGVNILQEEYELEVGDALDMSTHLTVDGPGGFNGAVEWTSTDDAVAVVEDGKIVAKAAGKATLRAKAVHADVYDECTVTVYDKPTGIDLCVDGVSWSMANPVEFEVGDEKVITVKVLPETAKQGGWRIEYDNPNQTAFEVTEVDASSVKFKAISSSIERITFVGPAGTSAFYAEFRVKPPFEIIARVSEAWAGCNVIIDANREVATDGWAFVAAPFRYYQTFKGTAQIKRHTEGNSAVFSLPLLKKKDSNGFIKEITDYEYTIKATSVDGREATCKVKTLCWEPFFMDSSTETPLDHDAVGVGQGFYISIRDSDGEDVLVEDWKDAIKIDLDTVDAYSKQPDRIDGVQYMFEEGADSYKIVISAKENPAVKYEYDFAPTL